MSRLLNKDACKHPGERLAVVYDLDGCNVERCADCGFSISEGEVSEFRTCPFCGDWFIDRIEQGGDDVVCQGCGAEARADVWNDRAYQ